jgi:O-antigen/teichoic acid export membrane protein
VTGYGRDIFWAYALSAARVASWIVVYGTLYRRVGAEAAALLALVRWTLGLLNYASAGLAPAILHYAAKANSPPSPGTPGEGRGEGLHDALTDPPIPNYATPNSPSPRPIFQAGVTLSWIGFAIGFAVLLIWTLTQGRARGVATLVGLFGTGMLIDMAADAWGAIIQSKGPIRRDYQAQTSLEILWAILATAGTFALIKLPFSWQTVVGGTYLCAAIACAAARAFFARRILQTLPDHDGPRTGRLNSAITRKLLTFGGFVVLAQIADFLYAPTDFLLIRWLIDLKTVAIYAPAVQMDAGIWLLVGGLSTALLPMSAAAFGKGDFKELRRYYLQGTAVTFALLVIVCVLAWIAAPGLFRLWLGNKMKPTQEILPLVLIPTVIGGSAAVGRSILLAIGKVKAFTAAVLIAGLSNVILSYSFVKFGGMGLEGIILGTILVVIVRCAIWMPWYVLRSLRQLSPQNPAPRITGVSPVQEP